MAQDPWTNDCRPVNGTRAKPADGTRPNLSIPMTTARHHTSRDDVPLHPDNEGDGRSFKGEEGESNGPEAAQWAASGPMRYGYVRRLPLAIPSAHERWGRGDQEYQRHESDQNADEQRQARTRMGRRAGARDVGRRGRLAAHTTTGW
jgi:hypothetical protein